MNNFQKKVAKMTKKRLDLDTKVEEFSKELEGLEKVGDIEAIFDKIAMLPSWYETKKQIVKELKAK